MSKIKGKRVIRGSDGVVTTGYKGLRAETYRQWLVAGYKPSQIMAMNSLKVASGPGVAHNLSQWENRGIGKSWQNAINVKAVNRKSSIKFRAKAANSPELEVRLRELAENTEMDEYDYVCPHCQAQNGYECTDRWGESSTFHPSRLAKTVAHWTVEEVRESDRQEGRWTVENARDDWAEVRQATLGSVLSRRLFT
jgi:hypothetical protein